MELIKLVMTPKEKAKELVEKYLNTIIHFPYIDTKDGNCIGTGYMTHNSAVRCAINLVEEIIKEIPQYDYAHPILREKRIEYYHEVKQEIEKL
jgi:pyridoxal/pyridoxine/pyridoxamine kinase